MTAEAAPDPGFIPGGHEVRRPFGASSETPHAAELDAAAVMSDVASIPGWDAAAASMPHPMAWYDRGLRCVWANAAYARMTGRTTSEIIGLALTDAHPTVTTATLPELAAAVDRGHPLIDNALIDCGDGIGLPHRGELLRRVSTALDQRDHQAADLVLLIDDIDDFKAVNDTYGHLTQTELRCQPTGVVGTQGLTIHQVVMAQWCNAVPS